MAGDAHDRPPEVSGFGEPDQGCWFCATSDLEPHVALMVGLRLGSGFEPFKELPVVCCDGHRLILEERDAEALRRLRQMPHSAPARGVDYERLRAELEAGRR